MADNMANAANLDINTSQPKPLRGLILRGVKQNDMIQCDGLKDGRPCLVKAEDYDKALHGPKSKAEKLPTRSKTKATKPAEAKDEE